MIPRVLESSEFRIDLTRISPEEARAYLEGLNLRERGNFRRAQAWFDHCARIRENPSSNIAPREGASDR